MSSYSKAFSSSWCSLRLTLDGPADLERSLVHYVNELLCMPLLFVSAYNSVLLACPLQTAIPVLFIPVLMLYHNWDLHTLKRISHVERCHVVTQHCSVTINPKFMWPLLIAFCFCKLCVFAYRHVLPPVHMLSSHYALCFCLMTQTGMLCEYWWTPKTWGPPSPSITNKSSWPFSVKQRYVRSERLDCIPAEPRTVVCLEEIFFSISCCSLNSAYVHI